MTNRTIEFTLNGSLREVDDTAVEALDHALARAVGAPADSVMHAMDPTRLTSFEAGGPPVWSVAFAQATGATPYALHLTYGLSGRVDLDPAREPLTYELSFALPTAQGGIYPAFLLRALSRYILTSRRHLEPGQHMDLGGPILRVPLAPHEREQAPDSALTVVALAPDPVMPKIETPRGPVEVRRVYGLRPEELSLVEAWSVGSLLSLIRERDPLLLSDLERPSWALDPALRAAVEAGTRRDGAAFGALPVEGIRWEQKGAGFRVYLPGGDEALRIRRMIDARIPFGRNLMLHAYQPEPNTDVGLTPSPSPFCRVNEDMLEIGLPPDSPLLRALSNPGAQVVWELERE